MGRLRTGLTVLRCPHQRESRDRCASQPKEIQSRGGRWEEIGGDLSFYLLPRTRPALCKVGMACHERILMTEASFSGNLKFKPNSHVRRGVVDQ